MDGLTVLALTRSKPDFNDMKILVISAQPDSDLRMALEKGADGVLAKPFDNEQLLQCINNWFSIK